MKTTPWIVALAVLTATGLWASETKSNNKPAKGLVKKEKGSKVVTQGKEKNVLVTGSYIKRDIRRAGTVTDGPNPLYVLDRQSIDLSGAADLSQVLIRTGFHR